jgi:hypothetical protein
VSSAESWSALDGQELSQTHVAFNAHIVGQLGRPIRVELREPDHRAFLEMQDIPNKKNCPSFPIEKRATFAYTDYQELFLWRQEDEMRSLKPDDLTITQKILVV